MEDLAGERILVTGGAGFIGTGLSRALVERGAHVIVADLREPSTPGVTAVVGDLREAANRERALLAGTTTVVHLAAMTSVLRSMRMPLEVFETNVAMTAALLELSRARRVDRFVLASTNAVIGDVGRMPIHEGLALDPLTPYGATKAAGEMLLAGYRGSLGLDTCALRLTNVYGPGMQAKDSLVPRLMRAALSGDGIDIYGSGAQQRDFVHLDDVCDAFVHAVAGRMSGTVIIGSGHSPTVLDVVELARTVTGRPIPARHVDPEPGEMPAVIVDLSRARRSGYAPMTSLAGGLAGVWEDFRATSATATGPPRP